MPVFCNHLIVKIQIHASLNHGEDITTLCFVEILVIKHDDPATSSNRTSS